MTPLQTAVQAVITEWEEHAWASDACMEYLRKALEAEQAQAVEPAVSGATHGLSQDYNKGLGRWFADRPGARQQLRDDFPPPATGERAELIRELRSRIVGDPFPLMDRAADMLEADTQLEAEEAGAQAALNIAHEQYKELKVQQVAAPDALTGDQIIEWMRQRGLEQLDAENQALCVKLIRAYEENPKIGAKP